MEVTDFPGLYTCRNGSDGLVFARSGTPGLVYQCAVARTEPLKKALAFLRERCGRMERQMLSHMSEMSLGWFRLKHVPSPVLRYKFVTKKFGGGLAISICLPLLLLHSCVFAYSRTRLTLLQATLNGSLAAVWGYSCASRLTCRWIPESCTEYVVVV